MAAHVRFYTRPCPTYSFLKLLMLILKTLWTHSSVVIGYCKTSLVYFEADGFYFKPVLVCSELPSFFTLRPVLLCGRREFALWIYSKTVLVQGCLLWGLWEPAIWVYSQAVHVYSE